MERGAVGSVGAENRRDRGFRRPCVDALQTIRRLLEPPNVKVARGRPRREKRWLRDSTVSEFRVGERDAGRGDQRKTEPDGRKTRTLVEWKIDFLIFACAENG